MSAPKLNPADLQKGLAGVSLKATETASKADESLQKAHLLRELGSGGVISVPEGNAPKNDAALTHAQMQRSINTQGVIAVPKESAPKDLSMATALTQVAINRSDGKAANSEKVAKLDAGKARTLTELAIKSGKFTKKVDTSKIPDSGPSKELLASVQKEAAEVKEAQEKQKQLVQGLDLGSQIAKKPSLKKVDRKGSSATANSAALEHAKFLREVGRGGVISVPEDKLPKADPGLARALLQKSIKTQGVIAVPSDKAFELEKAEKKRLENLVSGEAAAESK